MGGLLAITASPFFPSGTTVEEAAPLFSNVTNEIEKSKPQFSEICKTVQDSILDLRHAKGVPPVDLQKLDASLETFRNYLSEDVPAFRLLHERACKAFVVALGPPKRQVPRASLGETPSHLCHAAHHLNGLVGKVWTFIGDHLRVYKPLYTDVLAAEVQRET